ncbi:MAG: ATP-binding cassette domain-containing protein, partial [Desulfobacterales bacterium]
MIELKGIGRTFQVGTEAVHALQAVDLTVRDGEYLSVMGPSGSGKSTLLNIIGLLDRPDSGIYRLDDVNATELNDTQQAAV